MEIKMQERCMGCMKLLNWDGRCPHCGFEKSKYSQDAHYLPPGALLKNGDYMVGRVLGEGGFGITYMGFDQNLLSRVAIKEYYPSGFACRDVSEGDYALRIYGGDFAEDYKKGLEAFLEEARILARFAGMEGIVNVRGLFQENNTAYIVMEYVDGVSVKEYVQKHGKIEPEMVLGMMEQPMRALQAVHEEQLVHRDVSADNFMIGQDGRVTLIDFGAARYSNVIDEKTRTTICKQGFSALEQYSREGKQGPWTDVYSICATMYYMLTGIVPNNSTERIVDDAVVPLERMPEISLGVEKKRSIMTGMAVKSSERFQNMEILYLAVYGKALTDTGTQEGILSREEKRTTDVEKQMIEENAISPTGLLRELKQVSSVRKNREKRKKLLGIFLGTAVMGMVILCLWVVGRYAGFGKGNEKRHVSPDNQIQQTKKETVNTPEVSEKPADSRSTDNSQFQNVSGAKDVQKKTESEMVKMPEVAGMKKTAAVQKIKKTGLTCKLVYRNSSSVAGGKVIRASVSAGKSVKKGKKLILYVSKGKKTVKAKATPKPVVTKAPEKRQEKSTSSKSKDDNLAGDLDSIIY